MATKASYCYYGVFDLFKVGIGPSSSHTVGPMRAAERFLHELKSARLLNSVRRIQVDLYGSLALTGRGHATDTAIIMGLLGEQPDTVDPDTIPTRCQEATSLKKISLAGEHRIGFDESTDLLFNHRICLEAHPNGLRFQALGENEVDPLLSSTFFSIGGGFVVKDCELADDAADHHVEVPFPFSSARDLLEIAEREDLSIGEISRHNELALQSEADLKVGLDRIWQTMQACVERGIRTDGVLPGGLDLPRRAPALHQFIKSREQHSHLDPMTTFDWVDLYALAVNEENAAGGRVVTAPTNGAAGIIPAVLMFYDRFYPESSLEKIERFLLTSASIGSLYKRNASISGAEVGCQGEVGVACSMAAAGLTEVLGGTPHQVEEAAEIGMEHNLGLTCDPIKGLVQIPCIERNAMGAVKAINASRMALQSDGKHFVSLDRVIRVMKRTGAEMSSRYKETSQGGLAVNISEC